MFDKGSFTNLFYRHCVKGYERMSPEAQGCLTDSVQTTQGPNGFFCGRAGQEDLYYTFFGLLLMIVTGARIQRKKCDEKLQAIDFTTLDLVHACAWLRADIVLRWLGIPRFMRNDLTVSLLRSFDNENVKRLRRLSDLPKTAFPQQDKDSPYSQFLLSTLHTDFGKTLQKPNLADYRLSNGLYGNVRHHSEYGVNATAAALFLTPNDESVDALLSLQEQDGSFKAVASAPEGDLMSTATALFALKHCGKTPTIPVKPFLRECFRNNGFFAATPNDPVDDLEYTAYGLLAMGIIS